MNKLSPRASAAVFALGVALSSQVFPQTPASGTDSNEVQPRFIWGALVKILGSSVFSSFGDWLSSRLTGGMTGSIPQNGFAPTLVSSFQPGVPGQPGITGQVVQGVMIGAIDAFANVVAGVAGVKPQQSVQGAALGAMQSGYPPQGQMAYPGQQPAPQFPQQFPTPYPQQQQDASAYPQAGQAYPPVTGYPPGAAQYPQQSGQPYPQGGQQFPQGGQPYPQGGGAYPQASQYPQMNSQYSQQYPQGVAQYPQNPPQYPQGASQYSQGPQQGATPYPQTAPQYPQLAGMQPAYPQQGGIPPQGYQQPYPQQAGMPQVQTYPQTAGAAQPGYPQQPMAYPQQQASYPQAPGFPQAQQPYPGQPSAYPQQSQGAYPQAQSNLQPAYPQQSFPQPAGYPQQQGAYPQSPAGYPVYARGALAAESPKITEQFVAARDVVLGRPTRPLEVQGKDPNYEGVHVAIVALDSTGKPTSVRSVNDGFRTGEKFKLRVVSTFEGLVAIDNINPKGEQKRVYPDGGNVVAIPLGQEILIPLAADEWFELAGNTGKEQLVITVRDRRAFGEAAANNRIFRQDEKYGSNFVQEVAPGKTFPVITQSIAFSHASQ